MKVLIVDDSPDALALARAHLAMESLDLLCTNCGEAGLRLAETWEPDLILVDVDMPGMSGFDMCRSLQRDSVHNTIPIVFVTGVEDVDARVRGLELGAVDFITKPYDPAELRARVRSALRAQQLQQQLRAQAAFIQQVVDALPVAVFCKDMESRYTLVNQEFEQVFGMLGREMIGHTASEVALADLVAANVEADKHLLNNGCVQVYETKLRRPDGIERDVQFSTAVLCDRGGKVIGLVGAVLDLTQRRKTEALERERAALREAVTAMEHVLGVVAHELRTPLAGIRAAAEILLTEDNFQAGDTHALLQSLHDESVRMAGTISDLLEAARINSGRATWNWSCVELQKVCAEAMETVKPLIRGPEVALSCSIFPDALAMSGDPDAVRRMIVNLLSNSAKHTFAGQIEVSVIRDACGGHPGVRITVSDTGCGIPAAMLDRLGEAFALNSGVVGTHHADGTGLGLAICVAIAAVHGGRISMRSAVGSGTSISILLRADLAGPAKSEVVAPIAGCLLHGAAAQAVAA